MVSWWRWDLTFGGFCYLQYQLPSLIHDVYHRSCRVVCHRSDLRVFTIQYSNKATLFPFFSELFWWLSSVVQLPRDVTMTAPCTFRRRSKARPSWRGKWGFSNFKTHCYSMSSTRQESDQSGHHLPGIVSVCSWKREENDLSGGPKRTK